MKVLCIYHGNCADGFGAAWALRKYFAETSPEDEVEFFPGVYQKDPPWHLFDDNSTVYMVDFSYKNDVLKKICELAYSVVIIDHHKSVIEDLQGWAAEADFHWPGNLEAGLDASHSGAMLTWIHFFADKDPPKLLRHIEDRDLWKFELPGTREIQANLFSYPYDFETWDALMEMKDEDLEIFRKSGEAIERKHFKDIYENLNTSVRWMKIGGVEMPVINCPKEWGSDAANILAKNSANLCAAYYWDSSSGRNFGLRSSEAGPDVSEICKKYGGGGHHHAAGFRVDPIVSVSFEISVGTENKNVWAEFRSQNCIHVPE